MSEDNIEADASSFCASCGIAKCDDIKLKECTACKSVRYCGVKCQREHRRQHKRACKKRAAELRDELLFKQPESSYLGDCPICCLPLSLDPEKSGMMVCCSKVICQGCNHANQIREEEASLDPKCPFCREPLPKIKEEKDKRRMKRIEANDPVAMTQWGGEEYNKGNHSSAFEYYAKAALLGEMDAHFRLGLMYRNGDGVEKDRGKYLHHAELAAIGGHPTARCNLGFHEEENGDINRAVRHYIIAAAQGQDESIKLLMFAFKEGDVSKDDLAAALRAHQAAVDATKSPQRAAAEEYRRKRSSAD